MTVATFLTDRDPEISSFDAFYHNTAIQSGWSHYLGASSSDWGSGVDTGLATDTAIVVQSSSNAWYYARAGVIGFDISSIPAGSTINSVTLRVYINDRVNTLNLPSPSSDLVIRQANPTYNNRSSSGDVPSFGTAVKRVSYASLLYKQWMDIDLGSSGVQYVQSKLGGSVFFGIDSGARYDQIPEPAHSAGQKFQIQIMAADYTNTYPDKDYIPRLIVDYTPPPPPQGVFTQAIIIS